MKKRLLALTLSGLMLISSISPANIQAYASEPSDAFSTISGNDLPANQNEETDEESEETQESTETTNLDLNDFFDWDLSNSGFADISGNDAYLLTSLVANTTEKDLFQYGQEHPGFIESQFPTLKTTLKYTAGGKEYELKSDSNGKAVLPADVLPQDITYFSFELVMSVTNTDRQFGEGDYFKISIPDGMDISALTDSEFKTANGKVWATAKIDGQAIKITFTQEVEKKNAAGYLIKGLSDGLKFEFKFNQTELAQMAGKESNYRFDFMGHAITINVPKAAEEISGIDKTGKFEKTTGEISWEVTVGGKNDKAVSIAGYKFEDHLGEGQTLKEGSVKVDDVVLQNYDVTSDGFEFTFAEGKKGNSKVTYSTIPAKGFYFTENVKVSNTAKVTSTKDETNPQTFTAKDEVASPGQFMAKEGVQVSADEMQWTIQYNKEGILVYNAIVTDELSAGLEYIGGSILLNGESNTNEAIDAKCEGQKLTVEFKNSSVASKAYTITFKTKIKPDKFSGQGENGTEVKNTATVKAGFPSGNGTGEAVEYGTPSVETTPSYSAAYISKKVVSTSEADGTITWEVIPSTKDQGNFYKTAVVEDVLQTGDKLGTQEWIEKSEVVKLGETTIYKNGQAIGEDTLCTYDSTKHAFSFDYQKIAAQGKSLADVTITVKTKALDYFKNDEEHTYGNAAKLTLFNGSGEKVASANAEATTKLQNKMLTKTVSFERDNAGKDYFHYTIHVNQNHVGLTNAFFTDDISNAFYTTKDDQLTGCFKLDKAEVKDVSGATVDASKYKISSDGNTFTFQIGNSADEYTVDLYACLTDEGKDKLTGDLANKAIYTKNIAKIEADELLSTPFKSNPTKETEAVYETTVLNKTGNQVNRSIEWTVLVNAGSAELGSVKFTDTIPNGLYLDATTVKVRAAGFENNELIPAGEDLVDQNRIKKRITRKVDGTADLLIEFADVKKPYFVTYTTQGVGDDLTYENAAKIEYGNTSKESKSKVEAKSEAWSSGYEVVAFEISKVDALSDDKHEIPLEGAVYVLLSDGANEMLDADGKLKSTYVENGTVKDDYVVDIRKTGADGKTFFADKLDKTKLYYIAEKTAPSDYVVDETVYGPYQVDDYGYYNVGPKAAGSSAKDLGTGSFKDKREEDSAKVATLNVEKIFDKENGMSNTLTPADEIEKTVEFELYIFPDKTNANFKRLVKVKGEGAGVYSYEDQNADVGSYTEILTASGTDKANLTIQNLPWGEYELVEKKAADGFLPSGKVRFSVDGKGKLTYKESGSVDAAVNTTTDNTNTVKVTVANHRTKITLKKIGTDSTGNNNHEISDMTGVTFTLTPDKDAKKTDGTPETFADGTSELILNGEDLKGDGVTLSGLCKVGVKYTIKENNAPKGYQTMKEVTFMINDGSKAALGSIATVGGTTDTCSVANDTKIITLKNKPTAFDFVKVDQNGLGVADVVLTIAPEAGSSFAHASGNIVLTTKVNKYKNSITGEMVAGNTYVITETYGVGFDKDAYLDADGYKAAYKVSDDGKELIDVTLDSVTNKLDVKFTNATTKNSITITNHRVLAQMAMTKVDAKDNDVKLAGASFKLYRQTGTTPNPASDVEITSFDTAAGGTWKTVNSAATNPAYGNKNLSLGLPVGNYYLVETQAPRGYQIAKEGSTARTYSFSVTKADDGKTFNSFATTINGVSKTVSNITNDRIPGTIVVTKQDAKKDDTKLAGAVFALYVKNGTVLTPATISTGTTAEVDGKTVPTVTTAADGKATFTGLPWGTYVVKELTAPAGYELNPLETDGTALKEITIDATTASPTEEKNEVTKTITDRKTNFKLRKIDQNGMPVEGAILTLLVEEKDAEGNVTRTKVDDYITAGTDIELNGVLKAGYSYSLTEKSAAGFFVTSGMTHFTVSADGTKLENLTEDSEARYVNLSVKLADTDKTVELTNTRYLEGLEITKVDKDTQSALAGAEFVLYQQKGATADPATDIKVVVNDKGASQDANGKPYVLTSDANGKINLKDDAYKDLKNGAIRDNSGNLIKDKDGNLQPLSEGLGTGNYYLIETKAPEGYTLDTNVKYEFNITQKDEKNQVTAIQIENKRILGTLTFTSKDEKKTDEAVPGVVYGLYEKSGSTWIPSIFPTGSTVTVDGKTVPTITTDAYGDGKIENLPWGKEYALMEIQDSSLQPQGYVLNPAVTAKGKDKDHSDDPTSILFGTPAVTGKTNTVLHVHTDLYIQPIILDIHKVGPQNEPLAGATVKVTGSFADGTTEKTFTTEVDGTETWNKLLKPGETYHVTEVTPAPTYGSTTDFDFVVGTDGFVSLDAGTKAKLQKETSYGKVEDTHARHSQITVKSPQTILNFSTDVNRYEQGLQTAMQKPSTLAGIQYQVYSDEDCKTKVQKDGLDVTASSDKDGKVVIPGLPAGTYYIKEIGYDTLTASAIGKPDATAEELTLAQARLWGTKLTSKVYRGVVTNSDFGGIEVKEGDTWKAVENGIIHHEVYSGEIKFTKVDKDDNSVKLADSTYGLYRSLDSYPEAIKAQAETLIAQKKLATYAYQGKTYVLLDKQVTSSEAGKEGDIVFQVPLAAEEYLIKELQAPAGHKVSADPVLVSMHLGEAPEDGAAAITTILKNNGNGTMTTGANGLTWFEPRIKLQVKTLINARLETAVGQVHLVLKDKDGNIVDEWDTTIEEYVENKEVDVLDVDDEGKPVLDTEGKQTTHKEVQQVKKQRVLDEIHTVVDTANLLKVGETYTITTTSVPAGFVPTTVSFKVNTVEVPAYTDKFPTEFIQVEKIVIGKKAAPTQRNTSSNSNGGNQGGNSKPQNPAKDTVSPEKTGKDPIVVIQDSASLIEKAFTSNGKDGKGSLFGKSRKGTSVATAGSRKENGVVRSVRRALEAAFGAISGSYRKLVTKTGDEAPIIGMIALLLIAVAGITTVMIHKRKKK